MTIEIIPDVLGWCRFINIVLLMAWALALIVVGSKVGLYLGIFTSVTVGVLQALVHGLGFIKEDGMARNVGVGFYSSIPFQLLAPYCCSIS